MSPAPSLTAPESEHVPRPRAGCLRLFSANLWNGRADPEALAAIVGALAPDVVAVQELDRAQAAALSAVMPHGTLEPASDYTGMGIALRHPGSVRRICLPVRDARATEVAVPGSNGNGQSIEVINIHVQAPHVFPVPSTFLRRRGQLRGLQRHLDATPRRRRVVVGDFNATPGWPVYERIAARLTDAAVSFARRHGRPPERTWGPWPSAPRLLRIDHAFVSGLAVEYFRLVLVPGSDHRAILIDVAVEEEEVLAS
ncbi:MAG TPA: endonuclease/exonuclease/phosphatase family protein [Candidatus Binatia bacterium]|nr:endonuclease/exonuclease/phosphatase family protein [Candidatus Binatia bacterium]